MSYISIDKDKAKEILGARDGRMLMSRLDFKTMKGGDFSEANASDVFKVIDNCKTIVYMNGGVSTITCYSEKQNILDIKRKGTVYNILYKPKELC